MSRDTLMIMSSMSIWACLILSAVHLYGGSKWPSRIFLVLAVLGSLAQVFTRGFA